MKKLMFAAVAAAAMSAVAIESNNIVGYGPTQLPNDGLSVGASFVTVSGEKIDLMEISVIGYKDAQGEGSTIGDVQVQTLNGGGATQRTFIFADYIDDGTAEQVGPGWFDADNDYAPLTKGEVTLEKGEGLWSVTMADGLSLRTSGEVPTQFDVATPLPNDGLTLANPTPITVDLMDCYVYGYKDEQGEGSTIGDVQVQTLNGGGATQRTFIFADYIDDGTAEQVGPGWFDADNDYAPLTKGEITCAPGAGLWSVTMADNLYFCWPKVEVK